MSQPILVTGGTGYIGSHTVVELIDAGHEVVVVDNLVNSSALTIDRIEQITGTRPAFHEIDLCDAPALDRVMAEHLPGSVIHFAALKAVGESVEQPVRYYRNNIDSSLNLIDACARHGCETIVFSSSATVYGDPESVPIPEDAPVSPTNPYGWTKLMVEQILTDATVAQPTLRVALLRYFNPAGAHPSGVIGEDPHGIPNNLMPYLLQVAVGRRDELLVFGDDYDTPDGTGVRDYVHVIDVARGHLAALNGLARHDPGAHTWNLGTGRGASVHEVRTALEEASGRTLPYRVIERRAGDITSSVADPAKADAELGWSSTLTLADMCRDAWRWQSQNPDGYESP